MHRYITVVSQQMTERSENNVVRLSSSARTKMNVSKQKCIEIWTKPEKPSVSLPVKPAYKQDIAKAKREGLRLKDVVFVSANIARLYEGDTDNVTWADTKPRKCAIGSDPEIMMLDGYGLIYAGDYVPFDGEIGSDGPMLELRPSPGTSAEDHVSSIEVLINNLASYIDRHVDIEDVNLVCTPLFYCPVHDNTYTSGGHIHLGISSFFKDDDRGAFGSDRVTLIVNGILNICLALPLQLLDGALGTERREYYGYLDDIRTRPNRLEFRTLSSTWLLYKDLAKITLNIAHELTIAISNKLIEFKKAYPNYENDDTYDMISDVLGMPCMQGEPHYETLDSLLHLDGCNVKDVYKYSIPVLEKMLSGRLINELITICENCNSDKINRNLIHNWTNNISIESTF